MKFMPSSKLLAEEVRFANEVIGMPWSGAVIGGLVEAEGRGDDRALERDGDVSKVRAKRNSKFCSVFCLLGGVACVKEWNH